MKTRKKPVALIVAPHEDDELNIAGPVFQKLAQSYKIIVVFMTNGDYGCSGEMRWRETYRALKWFGISKDQILFLGYPDQYMWERTHFYISLTDYEKRFHKKYTYGTSLGDEYCYISRGIHRELTDENLICDLECIVSEFKPAVIIGVDYDSHPDHRVLSLTLDRAIGNVLREHKMYTPLVLKVYAYGPMYEGFPDYTVKNLRISQWNHDSSCNPFFGWEDRLQIPTDYNKILFLNKLYLAYGEYKSQKVQDLYERLINSDYIFWLRRSDNLIRFNTNKVPEVLYDFSLFDTKDIMNGKPLCADNVDTTNGLFLTAHDILPIKLDQKYHLESIWIYFINMNHSEQNISVQIYLAGKCFKIHSNKPFEKLTIDLRNNYTNEVIIQNVSDQTIFLAQVEIFEKKKVVVDQAFFEVNNSVDKTIYFSGQKITYGIKVLEKYGRNYYQIKDEYKITIKNSNPRVSIHENEIFVLPSCNRFSLTLCDSEDRVLGTSIFIRDQGNRNLKVLLIRLINHGYIRMKNIWRTLFYADKDNKRS